MSYTIFNSQSYLDHLENSRANARCAMGNMVVELK